MKLERGSGILLHPTSLSGRFGIGDLGTEAYRFVDWLKEAGQRLWQVLPLGPTGYGDSPYQSFSSFAGNPLLVSPELLDRDGLLPAAALADVPPFPTHRVDYGWVLYWKRSLLGIAYEHFRQSASDAQRHQFDHFCRENSAWLEDFALFMALKEAHDHGVWTLWAPELGRRDPHALEAARHEHAQAIGRTKFAQWQFFQQWAALRRHCAENGVRIVGDIPIYAAHDSADVWASPDIFVLDKEGQPTVVGGVPPDYFSKTGQLWGNPLYNWDRLAATGYKWWIERVRATLRLCDFVRIDHFRGFEAYWEIPAGDPTAERGRWVDGPRDALFHAFQKALGHDLPIVAENLGVITAEVEALRERFELPGMAVFQFGFGHNARTSGLPPHTYTPSTVAYTGTHDNDTLAGWWKSLRRTPEQRAMRDYIKKYLDTSGRAIHWVCIRALMASVADWVVFPVQDVLGLGSEGRMNTPGVAQGNWGWRMENGDLDSGHAATLRDMTETYGREGP